MEGYKKQWVIIILPYERAARWIQAFRIAEVSTAAMHHNGCSMSVYMSVAKIE
jgi:hypothetical protein